MGAGRALLCAGLVALFSSCTDFFASSLAPWAARDPASLIPPVTSGNVDELVKSAENNPDLSLELLKGIEKAARDAKGGEKSDLQAAALKAASNASGLGSALMHEAGNIAEIMENKDNAPHLVAGILENMGNLTETGAVLSAVLPEPGTAEYDAFVKKSSADDLAVAAAILLASEAKSQDSSEDYLSSFDSSDPGALSESELLAVELAKSALAKEGDSGLSGRLKEILEGIHLLGTP
jgi:hypothetical protein